MRVLINGTSGSLGHWVAKALVLAGHEVHESNSVDITNRDIVMAEMRLVRPHVVVHMAAMVRSDVCRAMPAAATETNVNGTSNVVQAAQAVGAKLVYFSTADVYKVGQRLITEASVLDPDVTHYARTKYDGETISLHYVPDATIIRPGMTFGPRPQDTSILSDVIASHWTKRWVNVLMDPTLVKDYTAAVNVAEIVRLVIDRGAWGEVYNTGSGEERTYNGIMAGFEKRGIRPSVKFWPGMDYIGSRVFSTEKLRSDLKYSPVMSFDYCVEEVFQAAGRRYAAGV